MKNNRIQLFVIMLPLLAIIYGLTKQVNRNNEIQETIKRVGYTEESVDKPVQVEPQPEPAQEEAPQEPEPEEVEYFYVDARKAPVKCKQASGNECGANLERCDDGFNYYCVQNLKAEYRMELPKPE